ncbi:MAG: SpoIID/LytB domain-containing protein [Candidatus Velthaea sp.]
MTGGLDVWSTPAPALLRVLIAADRGTELPQADGSAGFSFGGKRWRGRPAVVPLAPGREGVVANLDVDAYLYGVVPLEASAGWPAAALQAQAIVARTYALAKRTLSRPYDVVLGESDQRYGGLAAESPATNAAVDATRGQILAYAGGPASVFYAACCGGHTADAAELWGRNTLPYLRGVPDPYCAAAPDYRWQRRIVLERFAAALGARGPGAISAFAVGPPDGAGRPRTIEIVGTAGRSTLTPAQLRAAIGPDIVRSTWIRAMSIDTTQAGPQVVIEGSGRGHGVGFCQWGARFMSADGAGARDILALYFPGTTIAGG